MKLSHLCTNHEAHALRAVHRVQQKNRSFMIIHHKTPVSTANQLTFILNFWISRSESTRSIIAPRP